MRRITLSAMALLLAAGCSSGGDSSSSTTTVKFEPIGAALVTERDEAMYVRWIQPQLGWDADQLMQLGNLACEALGRTNGDPKAALALVSTGDPKSDERFRIGLREAGTFLCPEWTTKVER